MIVYYKLWKLMKEKGLKKADLKEIISAPTISKLSKNEPVSITIIGKICDFLDCQPGEILENINEKEIERAEQKLEEVKQTIIDVIDNAGIDKELLSKALEEGFPKFLNNMLNDGKKENIDEGEYFKKLQENINQKKSKNSKK